MFAVVSSRPSLFVFPVSSDSGRSKNAGVKTIMIQYVLTHVLNRTHQNACRNAAQRGGGVIYRALQS